MVIEAQPCTEGQSLASFSAFDGQAGERRQGSQAALRYTYLLLLFYPLGEGERRGGTGESREEGRDEEGGVECG